ncbi:hypothetical protein [Williamsia sp. DF01-3]|uniref:hypothetical protein n=1 Tax=Williamsia sp. DF01-3 TaxID=2934157 RepID=UPI001FF16214|nr:hypothetical protein [Williamsia sp. DF01-3]MCK0516165.1 hypothetical protein [Williamsia sp. DF01-3]
MSGLRSAAGLARTAAMFDIWNPSSGTAEALLDRLQTMREVRPDQVAPVRLFLRSYLQRPTDAVGSGGQGVDGVRRDIRTAVAAGAEQFIVEINFWDEMRSTRDWAQAPARLATLLESAEEESAAAQLAKESV